MISFLLTASRTLRKPRILIAPYSRIERFFKPYWTQVLIDEVLKISPTPNLKKRITRHETRRKKLSACTQHFHYYILLYIIPLNTFSPILQQPPLPTKHLEKRKQKGLIARLFLFLGHTRLALFDAHHRSLLRYISIICGLRGCTCFGGPRALLLIGGNLGEWR